MPIDLNEWAAGALAYPDRMLLTPEQQDEVCRMLRSVGIDKDPFSMDPHKRREFLSSNSLIPAAVYAAICEVTRGQYKVTQSFGEWCRGLGLS